MSRSLSALGTTAAAWRLDGPMLALWASPRLSRNWKNERTEEKARAVEVRARLARPFGQPGRNRRA